MVRIFILALLLVIFFILENHKILSQGPAESSLSCQAQSDGRRVAICIYGHCPLGWRTVFYDYGCRPGQRCCI